MNRGELRAEIAYLLNFDEDLADQDFTSTRLNKAIQYAYRNEVRTAKLEGQSRWFKYNTNITWPVSQVTLTIPDTISQHNIIAFWDITGSNPGTRLIIRESSLDGAHAWWVNSTTLQWGSSGPSSELTIQVDYMANAELLVADADHPKLIPPEYHDLLVWSAAIYLRNVADEKAPETWLLEQRDMRNGFWKFLSRGRPLSDAPTVTNSFVNEDSGILY